ncbi:MAG: response regulator [Spirosomataceae bacterium]
MTFYKLKQTLLKDLLLFLGIGLSLAAEAQIIPSPLQKQRINHVYRQLQREILSLPRLKLPCPDPDEILKTKTPKESYRWVKQIYQNGEVACADQWMLALRPASTAVGEERQEWMLQSAQLLRATERQDSASGLIHQLAALPMKPHLRGRVQFEQAALYRKEIQFEKALQAGQGALQTARSEDDLSLEIYALTEIGRTSRDIYRQEPAKYLPFFQEALNVANTLKDSLHFTYVYQNLVFVYFFDNSLDMDKALDHFDKALTYFPRSASLTERYRLLYTFTTLLSYLPSEFDRTIELYRHLLILTQQLGLVSYTRDIYLYMSDQLTYQKKWDLASAYLDSAMHYDSPDWEKDNFYANRARVAQAMGDVLLANQYYQKALDEKERVYLRRNNQSMTRWETQLRTREKELQLDQQKRQQWLLVGIVALVSLLLAVAVYSFLRNRRQLRKLAQQNAVIEQQSHELRSLDKAKTRFFSNITHEFRTPLTLILTPLEGLMQELPQQKTLKTIYANAYRLLTLINQLLDLSKIDAGALQPDISQGDIASFLYFQAESFQSLAESRGIALQFDSQLPLPTDVYFDADKLSKIITNLLSNALKFTPKGGTVIFACKMTNDEMNETEKGKAEHRPFVSPPSHLVIQIKDTGIGIPEVQLEAIFDRFYQADSSVRRSFEGTGIGLALVKELVEVLKGKIRVESTVGAGTAFYLLFPADAETWGITSPEGLPVTPVENKNELPLPSFLPAEEMLADARKGDDSAPVLLIVEDNPELRHYMADLFQDTCRVVTATDGQDGLERAFEHVPDIVLTDWMMPHMDGITLSRHLKTDMRTNHIPIVMLTAKSAVESRLEGFEGGADDYIVKPFHAAELQLKVRNWLQRQERLRRHYTQRLSQLQENPPIPEIEADLMARIFHLIDENLADRRFGVEALSEGLQLNRRTLQRKLSSITHLSPNELIRNHRLRRALPLLKRGDNIADVAFQVGFETPSYFSKCFKEVFGQRPSEVTKLP